MATEPATGNSNNSLNALRIDRTAAPRRRRIPWGWLVLLLLVAGGGAYGFVRFKSAPQPVEATTVALVYPAQGITLLNATGRVVAQRRAAVSSKATGRLEALNVQEGQAVRAGEVVARIESRDVAAQREQAAAGVRQAEANLEQGMAELNNADVELQRQRDLAKQSFVSQAAVDTAAARQARARAGIAAFQAAIGVAQANLKVTEVAVEQTFIRAPFDGVVLTKSANVGDIITPFSAATGTTGAVVTMADMTTLEVEADVSESSIAKITEGQSADIQLDAYPDLRLAGKVSRLVPTVDRSKATILVKITFVDRDRRVLPDMSAKVAFLSRALVAAERQAVVAIRADAIAKREGRDVVFVLRDGNRVEPRTVQLGEKLGDLVRVVGVKAGERIVVAPSEKLGPATLVSTPTK